MPTGSGSCPAGKLGPISQRPSVLLLASAVVDFAAALPLIFAPEKLLSFAGSERSMLVVSLLQVIGTAASLFFGQGESDGPSNKLHIEISTRGSSA